MSTAEIDLHGFHPTDDNLYPAIRDAIRAAHAQGAAEVRFIHGHGFNRSSHVSRFVNSNTGYLGQTVRGELRSNPELRMWMLAKIDCSDIGATTVRLRRSPVLAGEPA